VCVVRRYLVDWTEFSRLGAEAAAAVGAAEAEARLRSFASRPWTDLGNPDRARTELDSAVSLAEPLDRPRLLASVQEMLGRYYASLGEHRSAEDAYQRAIAVFTSVDDRRGSAFVTVFLGQSLLARQEWAAAADTLAVAREAIRTAGGNRRMEGRALTSLAVACHRLGRWDEAIEAAMDAIAVLKDDNPFYEARAQELLVDLAEDRGEVATATAALTRALELRESLRDPAAAKLRTRLDRMTDA